MRRFVTLAVLSCAMLTQVSACGGSTDASEPNVVQVTLSGAKTGTFRVSAATQFDPFGTPETDKQLAGYFVREETDTSEAYFGLMAIRPAGNGLVDILEIYAYAQTGTQNFGADDGPSIWISYGVPVSAEGYDWGASSVYYFPEGRVTIQELSENRFVGSFSATGYGFTLLDDVTLSSGTFTFGAPTGGGLGSKLCRAAGC